ncbi:MAG: AAA family ATPase [Bryobacteraceae bacterium]|jgi:predicted ATPase
MTRLASLTLRGFKTIRDLTDFQPGQITMLIGPNGAGKSNLISFFRLLSRAFAGPDGLVTHIAEQGGASALLHDGPSKTPELEAILRFDTDVITSNEYGFRLSYAAGDTLILADEWYGLSPFGMLPPRTTLGGGQREPRLMAEASTRAQGGDLAPMFIWRALRNSIVHQFQDTSPTSRMRFRWAVDDGRSLKEDAGNLAPVLYRLQEAESAYYRRIVETLRLVLPFFADFELQPEFGKLLLKWRERGSDQVFGASQAGDGMLRVMALVTLLQQPEADLPNVLILDEPELGLHPYAIEILAALIQSASQHCQVIIATQSVSLIDRFEPHDIVVVDRNGRESSFRRLDDSDLAAWREEYTMSELWEKNVLGGRPTR